MRALLTVAAILAFMGVLAPLWLWAQRRMERARRTPDQDSLKRARANYLGYDAAVDTIERLLMADESRLLFTKDEQIELRAHVVRFQNINGK